MQKKKLFMKVSDFFKTSIFIFFHCQNLIGDFENGEKHGNG